MESIKADGELAAEMVVLLGKELKVARRKIQELEEKQVPHMISSTNAY